LDATVTYTDSSVRLPAGAAARVRVFLAGAEPVSLRRGMELPEEFIRADRDRFTTRLLVAGLSAIAMITLIVIGFVRVIRRREPVIEETGMSRRAVVLALAIISLLIAVSALNDFPASLLEYDTAEPWSSFITSSVVGVIGGSVFLLLLVSGAWLALNALRRRLGIPVFAPTAVGDKRNGALLAGAAMGSVFAIFGIVLPLVTPGLPSPPATSLASAVPVASQLLALPPFVLLLVPVVAVPLLVIAALARGWRSRLLLGLVLLALLSGAMLPASMEPLTPLSIAARLSALVAIIVVVRTWGSMSAASWIAAALSAYALFAARNALHSSNSVDAWTHVLAVIAAAGALVLVFYFERGEMNRGLVAAEGSQGAA
ncbi:MAG: hypothetical protein ACR2L6_07735, partial [Gemmatimonadaceae bacterium]